MRAYILRQNDLCGRAAARRAGHGMRSAYQGKNMRGGQLDPTVLSPLLSPPYAMACSIRRGFQRPITRELTWCEGLIVPAADSICVRLRRPPAGVRGVRSPRRVELPECLGDGARVWRSFRRRHTRTLVPGVPV